jgi:hypothetical protein
MELEAKANENKWQVNVAVHYNSCDNLGSNEFRPVVDAYKELLQAFICKTGMNF